MAAVPISILFDSRLIAFEVNKIPEENDGVAMGLPVYGRATFIFHPASQKAVT